MAEASGIIGIVGVATQIIQIGIQVGLDWREAPDNARTFITELQALKSALSETYMNIIQNPAFKDAFNGRHSALLSQLGPLASDTDMGVMVSVCRHELERLHGDLKQRIKGHRVGWERLQGAFQATKTREAVENLHRQCLTLNQLLAIDALQLVSSTLQEVKKGNKQQQQIHHSQYRVIDHIRNRVDDWEASDEQVAVLNWLTPVDMTAEQNDFLSRRQKGTGQWLLDSPEFKAWVESKGQTLFCPGMPGAGKTILASVVVEELTNCFAGNTNVGIAYIYCNFRRQQEQKAEHLLASLLKQLVQSQRSLPESIKLLYEKHKAKHSRPTSDELSKVLQSLTTIYSRIFIIIDALDECSIAGRIDFLAEIFALREKSEANVFATSRDIPAVTQKFSKCPFLEIRASEQDIRRYIDGYLPRLPSFARGDMDLQEEMKSKIINAVDGMYVAAHPHSFDQY